MKFCPSCKTEKPLSDFAKNAKTYDKLQCYCRECNKVIHAYYKSIKKKPLLIKTCEATDCEVTFETRLESKRFCCKACSIKSHNSIKNKDKLYRFKFDFKSKFKRKTMQKPNNHKLWVRKEEVRLVALRDEGLTFYEIAAKLGRSYDSCRSRYKLLNKVVKSC
jgi:hypothetical protein